MFMNKKEVFDGNNSGKVENKKIFLKFLLISLGFFLFLVIIFIFFIDKTCGDKTSYGECSSDKPYFCLNGKLIEEASICGCPNILKENGSFCFSEYSTYPKNITLKYNLEEDTYYLDFVVYRGLIDYLSSLQEFINKKNLSREDIILRNINEPLQREYLLPLVKKIQNIAEGKEQAKIAISLVQNIPYGLSLENASILDQVLSSKYPYRTLYSNKGVCGEKSELLAFLLKELGYGVVIFYFPEENHESVGIKCSFINDFQNTGYCFIETTTSLKAELSSESEIIFISDGKKF
jgi:hypothetical protein